jgi:MerR family transcriptional regulator, light-induced transcriptional regulator
VPDIELQSAHPPPLSRPRPGRETGRLEAADGPARGRRRREEDVARLALREIAPLLSLDSERLQLDGARSTGGAERPCAFRRIDIEEFATLAICPGGDLWPYVEETLRTGVPVQEIFEDLLAPAAKRLGDLWESDDCDFLSVTTGAHRLHIAVRRLSSAWRPGWQGAARALFLPAPGETHVLGLSIVTAAFEQCGWSTDITDASVVYATVRRHWFDLVAFSISCDRLIDGLTDAAARIRRVSRNRNVFLLVGGPVVASKPELAASIGADALAATPQEAVVITRSLLRRRERRQWDGL